MVVVRRKDKNGTYSYATPGVATPLLSPRHTLVLFLESLFDLKYFLLILLFHKFVSSNNSQELPKCFFEFNFLQLLHNKIITLYIDA